MSKQMAVRQARQSLEQVLIQGDLSGLSADQRLEYARAVCKAVGISLLFKPFDYIVLKGKTVLYANRSCTEQLRKKHEISIKIVNRERVDNLYVVTAQARTAKGKEDESIGAVNIGGLRGEDLANALMKAETKAKRRVTLSISGLGMLDEIEAKQVAESEMRDAAHAKADESEATVESTTARPEFESLNQTAPQQESPTPPQNEYRLKAGKIKGKTLQEVPLKKLRDWWAWYTSQIEKGKQIHPDVQDDAFHIQAFLNPPEPGNILGLGTEE